VGPVQQVWLFQPEAGLAALPQWILVQQPLALAELAAELQQLAFQL
jgi:hypothetical protein